MPSGFAVCFRRGLVDHTTDADSLLHDDVLALIIMLRDTCFQFLEETTAFHFFCVICVMVLVLCFELLQHVPDH